MFTLERVEPKQYTVLCIYNNIIKYNILWAILSIYYITIYMIHIYDNEVRLTRADNTLTQLYLSKHV